MIKKVYLHIGVHKTASTSIQSVLSENHKQLRQAGFLYPLFIKNKQAINNHSVVFASMFLSNSHTYNPNVLSGYNTPELVQELNKNYHDQLKKQIDEFDGENLILSGEDFTHFNKQSIEKFKDYLSKITNNEIEFKIILFCRNPVSRARAGIQEMVKQGMPLDKAIQINKNRKQPYFKSLINLFSDVFKIDNILVEKFENAVINPFGPAGTLMEMIGNEANSIKYNFGNHKNKSPSYEATILLSAIYKKIPKFVNNKLNPVFINFKVGNISNLPGNKFDLSVELKDFIWNRDVEDVNWLCRTFSLSEYEMPINTDNQQSIYWDKEVLTVLQKRISLQPKLIQSVILSELLKEYSKYKDDLNVADRKRIELFLKHNQKRNMSFDFFKYLKEYSGSSLIIWLKQIIWKLRKINLFLVASEKSDLLDDLSLLPLQTKYAVGWLNNNFVKTTSAPILINGKSLTIKGWAVDFPQQTVASKVIIEIDGLFYESEYNLPCPDVAKYLDNEIYKYSGFEFTIPVSLIGKGEHKIKIHIISSDEQSFYSPDYHVDFVVAK